MNLEVETTTLINHSNEDFPFTDTGIQIEIESQEPQPESFWQGVWREFGLTSHDIMVTARTICFIAFLSIFSSEEELLAWEEEL